MGFQDFKSNKAVQDIFDRLRARSLLEQANDWMDLRLLTVKFNRDNQGVFADRARNFAGIASTGELALLSAILFATDFVSIADELSGARTWDRLLSVDQTHRNAIAECISRLNP